MRQHFATLPADELIYRLVQHPHPAVRTRFTIEMIVGHLPPGAEALEKVIDFCRKALLDLWPDRGVKRPVLDFLGERGLEDERQATVAARVLGEMVRLQGRADFERRWKGWCAFSSPIPRWPRTSVCVRRISRDCADALHRPQRHCQRTAAIARCLCHQCAARGHLLARHPGPAAAVPRGAGRPLSRVVSDYKYRPRDRLAFFTWLAEQDRKFLAALALKSQPAKERLEDLEDRLRELDEAHKERLKPFHQARLAYFNHVYQNQYELQLLLDPVITVHPDEVSFEAFSRDESTYARLAAKYELFEKVREFECGTTNIDFSTRLHGEMERMRSYRSTRFDVDPGGFTMTTGDAVQKEKKIALPDSWVSGFHQVHSTMTLALTRFRMAPVDLYNVCRYLRRHKARRSPRALRYELTPGKRVRVVVEPWEHVIELTETAVFDGPKALTVRTWGRDRLRVLARLIPVCQRIDVYLAGSGLPSMYVLDLGGLLFTLALSGWTDNDWTGGLAKFDLLTRRLTASPADLTKTYEALKQVRLAKETTLASATGLGVEKVRGSLSYLCQVGRAMYDLGGKVYRHRDLFQGPFSAHERRRRCGRRTCRRHRRRRRRSRFSTRAMYASSPAGRWRRATS